MAADKPSEAAGTLIGPLDPAASKITTALQGGSNIHHG